MVMVIYFSWSTELFLLIIPLSPWCMARRCRSTKP